MDQFEQASHAQRRHELGPRDQERLLESRHFIGEGASVRHEGHCDAHLTTVFIDRTL